ncbi:MAG: methyltransferase domain-containing protein, partial [Candidatus Latescibacteria bacterium]|nr:methyltransferase domain-containing protein [Candidatus Latescibacterota bacterium]
RPGDLFALGTIEDLFYQVGAMPLSGATTDLEALKTQIQEVLLDQGLSLHRQLAASHDNKRTSFRVVVQARDTSWRHYRRIDLQKALVQGIHRRFPRWRALQEDADLEFWLQQADRALLIGLRLSDRQLRHRTYKVANIPGSLRPTIANALVFLSGVQDGQVFLDPMCGAGTLMLERARAGRHHLLLGGDANPEAVAHAAENFGPRHRPRGILRWDATHLPLPDACVDRVAANLPWGGQHGTPETNPELYAGTLSELDRVLKPGGRAVFLTSEFGLLRDALKQQPELYLAEQIRKVGVLGREADIFVVGKKGG